eukprot:9212028-Ditylum_brightwellii.AAC.1
MDFKSPMCASVGWSTTVDVHGYLFIVATFALPKTWHHKIVYVAWYAFSLLNAWTILQHVPIEGVDPDFIAGYSQGRHVDLEYLLLWKTHIVERHGMFTKCIHENLDSSEILAAIK